MILFLPFCINVPPYSGMAECKTFIKRRYLLQHIINETSNYVPNKPVQFKFFVMISERPRRATIATGHRNKTQPVPDALIKTTHRHYEVEEKQHVFHKTRSTSHRECTESHNYAQVVTRGFTCLRVRRTDTTTLHDV